MTDRLQAELEDLRGQLESYRQRELADLRQRLGAALADASHYRGEAARNSEVGRQIHAEAQATIGRLRDQLQAKEILPNARPVISR